MIACQAKNKSKVILKKLNFSGIVINTLWNFRVKIFMRFLELAKIMEF